MGRGSDPDEGDASPAILVGMAGTSENNAACVFTLVTDVELFHRGKVSRRLFVLFVLFVLFAWASGVSPLVNNILTPAASSP